MRTNGATNTPVTGDFPEVLRGRKLMHRGAYADAAICLFRDWLPDYGFKLVMAPPLPSGVSQPAFASAWRRGEAQAVSHRAASPSLALLLAARCELTKLRSLEAGTACEKCNGLGWFVTSGGFLEICGDSRHAAC